MTDTRGPDRPLSSRFTDNPFRNPNATPEQIERIEKRAAATRIYRQTGDTTKAEDSGLFPLKPRRMWEYKGSQFHVVRKSEAAAYVGLKCDDHYHNVVVIGLTESEPHELLVGRTEETSPKYAVESLEQALAQSADLIIDECPRGLERRFVKQLDEFFSELN